MLQHYHTLGQYEIGIDESGRGPMFGRVYAACCVLPPDDESFAHDQMRDSKKIKNPKKMAELAAYIRTHALAYSIQYVEHDVVDRINILQATMQCMHAGIRDIINQTSPVTKSPSKLVVEGLTAPLGPSDRRHILVDGGYFKPFSWYQEATDTWINVPHTTVVKGDSTYTSIAAASILAKHARDEWIAEMCVEHPELVERYGLDTNMGYGTKRHMDGIAEYGLSPWHRKSFKLRVGTP